MVIQPEAVNPELLGQEQEAMTVQPFEVSFFYCFFFQNKRVYFLCSFFCFTLEQFFPSKSIGEWNWPLFLDGNK